MIVSQKYKFAYMPPPKTGATSMIKWLIHHYDAQIWTADPNSRAPAHDCVLHEEMKDYFVFGTVRNPYYHEASFWKYFHRSGEYGVKMGFLKSTERMNITFHRWFHMYETYCPPPNCVKFNLDMFIKLENIREDVKKLPFFLPEHENKLQHLNEGSQFIPYFTSEVCAAIKTKRQKDFDMFGYDTDLPSNLLRGPDLLFQ